MSDAKAPPEPSMEEIIATIKRIIAEEEQSGSLAPAGTGGSSDILELTEAVGDDGTVRHLPPVGPPRPSPPAETPATPEPGGRIEPAPPRPQAAVSTVSETPAERLVSTAAAAAAAAAFARLGTVPRERRRESELALAAGSGRTLEDIVRDLLRPMLQAWLDENLPTLVERMVRAELSRVVDEAGLH
jgi:uncharacterized protein